MSKWDVRRLCKSIQATALPSVTTPSPEEIGFCSVVELEEIGDTTIVVFRQGNILLTKIIAAQNEVALGYHKVRGL